ncbi:MAG: hypothetical protein IPP69_11520 [Flavobacteriales bacterium]|nr:hypothetical protein [Flavobacteriales bacterium]
MDHLDPLIAMLNEDEKNSFASHIDKSQRDNREIKLFTLLTDGVQRTPAELVRKLYGAKENAASDMMNAYHSLRKRLMNRLISFVISRAMKADHADNVQVPGTLALCEIFIHRERLSLAKHFLLKAEKKAATYRQYDMLDQLYNFQLAYSQHLEFSLNDIMLKSMQMRVRWRFNAIEFCRRAASEQTSGGAKLGETLHPASVTKLILDELQIDERDTAEPLFQFRMLTMYRTCIVVGERILRP